MKENYHYIIKFLRDNKYAITLGDFFKEFSSHPDYPSLYAITDTFKLLGIENVAATVPKEEFENLPDTFLAALEEGGQRDIVYVKKIKNGIQCYAQKENKKLNKTSFLKKWNGIIVAIEPNEVNKKDSRLNNQSILYLLFIIAVISGLSYSLYFNRTLSGIAFLFTSIIGIIISVVIVREDLGIYSEVVNKMCNASEKTSCGEVLSSKGANIGKVLSLSDLCIIYFLTLLAVCFFIPHITSLWPMFGLSVLALCFSAYSIYYQAVVVKKWCVLCLGITTILILQFWILFYSPNKILDLYILPIILFAYTFISLGWLLLKNQIKEIKILKNVEMDFLKFKRDRKIFEAILKSTPKINTDELSHIPAIQIGENTASTTVYGILNPSCGHCIKAFKEYLNLTKENRQIQLKLLFNLNPENQDNEFTNVAHTIISIFLHAGSDDALEAMKFWYKSGFDNDEWKKKYPSLANELTKKILSWQYDWCKLNKINYTPATIYQNHLYPMSFQLSDLKFFVNE